MKPAIAILLALTLVVFSGCSSKPNDAMVVCGTYAVPGFVVREMKGGTYTCKELERDTNGRLLYEFSTKNILSGVWETALVICQDYDKDFVYFYEDKCYSLGNDEVHTIDQFKQQNDWNKPLDYHKMSRREIVIAIPSYIMIQSQLRINDVLNACKKTLKDGTISIMDIQFVDSDGAGHELYYFTVYNQTGKYFAVVDQEYKVVLLEVTELFDISAYTAFKQKNGWVYGFGN